jgi:hypothetical protein
MIIEIAFDARRLVVFNAIVRKGQAVFFCRVNHKIFQRSDADDNAGISTDKPGSGI